MTDTAEFREILKRYLANPKVRQMKDYCAHGRISVLEHSVDVARIAWLLNLRTGKKADPEVLLAGAILHDFYLYDWHDAKLSFNIFKMHGYTHPSQACKNAVEEFDIDERVQEVIRCHMWPLTLRSMPRHREAVLVCIADKLCALKETFHR